MLHLITKKLVRISSVLIACALMQLAAPIAQAETVSNSLSFDHTKTGFQLRDIHTTLRCEQCHVDGIFKNTPKNCAGCHSIGSRVGATPKPAQHVQTNLACDICHTSPTSFFVKSYNHAGVSDNCASCHNGQYPSVVSKTSSHLPTLFPCEYCHNSVTSFANARMRHTGISTGCILCHNGRFPSAESRLPTHSSNLLACEICHTNFTSFDSAVFNHSANPVPVANICNTCHGVKPRVMGKPAGHFPTAAQCDSSGCHEAGVSHITSSQPTFTGALYSHSAADSCSTCHNGSYTGALAKTATHVPTTAQCSVCHTQANTSNYLTFVGGSFTHSTPPGVCSSCHNGATAKGKTPTHVLTTQECSVCHTQANTSNYLTFVGGFYTHAAPIGVCSTCHTGNGVTGKPSVHIITSADCGICHTQTNTSNYKTFLGATYNHGSSPGVCSTCHNGSQATGKPVYHIPTTAACDSSGCHSQANTSSYTTFFGVVYVHTTPIGVCSTCHNGTSAKGKSSTHVATTAACETCHTASNTGNYSTFLGAIYQHPSPPGACSTCHNGATAQGKAGPVAVTPAHLVTAQECSVCHTQSNTANYTTFKGATYTHASPPGACSTCHNGANAQGKAGPAPVVPAHIITTSECSVCHTQANTANYTTFLGATYTHATPPGVCATCHNGSAALGKNPTHTVTTLGCDSCHTQSNTSNYTTFKGATGAVNHATIVPAAAGSCQRSGCHNGVSAKGTSNFAKHVPLPSGTSCDAGGCHRYTDVPPAFAGALMNAAAHTVVAANACTTCHGVATYRPQGAGGPYGVNDVTGGLHVNLNTGFLTGLPCTNCHKSYGSYSGIASWAAVPKMDHNGAKTATVKCGDCHFTGTLYLLTSIKKKSSHGNSTCDSGGKCHGSSATTFSGW